MDNIRHVPSPTFQNKFLTVLDYSSFQRDSTCDFHCPTCIPLTLIFYFVLSNVMIVFDYLFIHLQLGTLKNVHDSIIYLKLELAYCYRYFPSINYKSSLILSQQFIYYSLRLSILTKKLSDVLYVQIILINLKINLLISYQYEFVFC